MQIETQSPTATSSKESPAPLSDEKFTLDTLNQNLLDDATKVEVDDDGNPKEPVVETETEPAKEKEGEPADTETEPEAETETETEQEQDQEQEQETEAPKGTRDYSKFPEALHHHLKNMSKAAFDTIGPMLLEGQTKVAQLTDEKKKLESAIAEHKGEKLPDSWYSHPDAYRITPQYQAVEKEFGEAQAETSKWGQILNGLESGQLRYDSAKNGFVENTEEGYQVPPAVRRAVEDARLAAYEKQKEIAAKGNALAEKFQSKHKEGAGHMESQMDKIFPWHKDEKHANQESFKKILGDFPETFRDHPVTKFAAAASLRGIQLYYENQDLKAQLKAKNGLKDDLRKAGPVPGKKAKTTSDPSEQKFKAEDLVGL